MADHRASSETALSRRRVILAGGSGAALLALPGRSTPSIIDPDLRPAALRLPAGATLEITRAADQLRLRVELVNLKRSKQRLVKIKGSKPAYLRFLVPAQHVDEQATTAVGSPTKMKHRVAGETRVVLAVPTPLPFTLEALLDWSGLALSLDPRAALRPGGTFPTGAPTTEVTALELPEGLLLTPPPNGRFTSQVSPVTRGAVTEEWTARLVVLTGSTLHEPTVDDPVEVRAIWTPGYPTAPAAIGGTDPYLRPVSTRNRRHLVRAMGDAKDTTEYPLHEAADATRLWLGATGGWLDLEASWEGAGLVAAWLHKATTGRDVSVTIVTRGYLAPFGVPASVLTVSERVFAVAANGDALAQLEQKEYLAITPTQVTSPRPFAPDGDRRGLFSSIRASGVFQVARSQVNGIDPTFAFLPVGTNGNPVKVPYTAVDRAGRQVTFSMASPFVDIEHAFGTGAAAIPQQLVNYLTDPASESVRDVPFDDQRVAYADEITPGDGSTTLTTAKVVFSARSASGLGASESQLRIAGQPAFFPTVEFARVRDDTSEALTGQIGGTVKVVQSDGWVDHGNAAANFGATFLTMVNPASLGFTGDSSGLMSPSFRMEQFGQAIGQSVTLPAAGTQWDPATALAGLPKLFGAISLNWILSAFNVAADLAGDLRLPRFSFDVGGPPSLPDEICYGFDWAPPMRSVTVGGTKIFCIADDIGTAGATELSNPFGSADSKVELHLQTCVSLDVGSAGETQESVQFSLSNVALQFPPAVPMLAVYLSRLSFTTGSDAKPEYDVDIRGIELVGPLNFVDALVDLLPDKLASFDVDQLADRVDVATDIALPGFGIGVFSLTNLRFGMGVDIPFGGSDPVTTTLSLGTRDNPFTLTIMGIGGFGSLEIEAAPHPAGLVRIEVIVGVIIEIAIDVVVAKGSLSAGFSLALEVEKKNVLNSATGQQEEVDEVTVTAALDCVGEVEVLGLITITIEFLLALEYQVNNKLLIGTARVTVEVDVAIAKKSVSFGVRQEFDLDKAGARPAGALAARSAARAGAGALGFADRFASGASWNEYCEAFA